MSPNPRISALETSFMVKSTVLMFCDTAGEAVHKNRRLKVSLSSFLYIILAFGLYYAVVDTGKLSMFIFGLLFYKIIHSSPVCAVHVNEIYAIAIA